MSGRAEPYGREGLPLEEARRRVQAAVEPITAVNTMPLAEALGRVNAAAVHASAAVPGFRASIMDGYALGQNHQPRQGESWQLRGRSAAGPSRARAGRVSPIARRLGCIPAGNPLSGPARAVTSSPYQIVTDRNRS